MFRQMFFFFTGLLLVLGIGLSSSTAQAQGNNTWTAQYYNNTSLSGSPNATATLTNLNVNWGNNAPANGIRADDWTAHFSTISYFNAENYRFSINADDAFRLYVNNSRVLETFTNPRPNTVVSVDVAVPTGNIPLQVDYREYIGPAFVYLSWTQINSTPNNTPLPQPQLPGQASLTINTGRLNLRSTPFIGDNVIKQLPNSASYLIIGRNATNDWYQIRDGQTTGWVAARYVIASNTANVPVVNTQVSAPFGTATTFATRVYSNTDYNVVCVAQNIAPLPIYRMPRVDSEIIGELPAHTQWLVIGFATDRWIAVRGNNGWVSGSLQVNYTGSCPNY